MADPCFSLYKESAAKPTVETLTFKIDPENAGTRLDAYLASQIDDWSRARLQRLIDDEDVLVNSAKPAKSSYKLRANDEVELELIAPRRGRFHTGKYSARHHLRRRHPGRG